MDHGLADRQGPKAARRVEAARALAEADGDRVAVVNRLRSAVDVGAKYRCPVFSKVEMSGLLSWACRWSCPPLCSFAKQSGVSAGRRSLRDLSVDVSLLLDPHELQSCVESLVLHDLDGPNCVLLGEGGGGQLQPSEPERDGAILVLLYADALAPCGEGRGGLVEQAVHSVDKIGWIMGDKPPISCRATGGLGAPQAGGNIFDHYHIAYEYEKNVWCHLGSRKAPGCFNENADYVRGTKGTLVLGRGGDPYIEDNDGKLLWRYRKPREGEANMYQVEHDELFKSIRTGQHINDGARMVNSTMMAIMGRMSAQTGKEVKWEEAMAANEDLFPGEENLSWSQSYKPHDVPKPGVFQIPGIGGVELKA